MTKAEIGKASTKELRAFYKQITGRETGSKDKEHLVKFALKHATDKGESAEETPPAKPKKAPAAKAKKSAPKPAKKKAPVKDKATKSASAKTKPKAKSKGATVRKAEAKATKPKKVAKTKAEKAPKAPRKKAEKTAQEGTAKRKGRPATLPPVGTVLTHDFAKATGTETVTATITAEGVEFNGETYSSLGAAAKAASGVGWNGGMFWKKDGVPLVPYPKHKPKEK